MLWKFSDSLILLLVNKLSFRLYKKILYTEDHFTSQGKRIVAQTPFLSFLLGELSCFCCPHPHPFPHPQQGDRQRIEELLNLKKCLEASTGVIVTLPI